MNRTTPLILAVALFMENMDSTVIATSLPAIAADIGTSPIALKLALTAYLVSLAIFIPISGWMADRFGAKLVFRVGDRRLHRWARSPARCPIRSAAFVLSRFLQGMGGAMMTPVARLVLVRTTAKSELVVAMAWLTIPALIGPLVGPPVGGFITTYLCLALDLPHQRADRHHRHLAGRRVPARNPTGSRRQRRSMSSASSCRRSRHPASSSASRSSACRRCRRSSASLRVAIGVPQRPALHPPRTAHAPIRCWTSGCSANPVFRTAVIGGSLFRIGIGAMPFLLPLMFQLGFGLTPFQSGMITFATAIGAHRR